MGYNLEVNGTLNRDIITDSLTPIENLKINRIVNGEIIENDNTFILTINYNLPGTLFIDGYEKKYLYLENNKEYTKAEIYMMSFIEQDGYAMEFYTDSNFTTEWNYILTENEVVYVKWVEHIHTIKT